MSNWDRFRSYTNNRAYVERQEELNDTVSIHRIERIVLVITAFAAGFLLRGFVL